MFRIARQVLSYFNSRIRFKIIFPFALLTLTVAVIGIFLTTRLVSGSLEERFLRQMIAAGSAVADSLGQRERLHLSALRGIAFTEGINEAITTGNRAELQSLLFPLIVNYNVDRVDIIDAEGRHLIEIHRPPGTDSVEDYITSSGADVSSWPGRPVIQKVLYGVVEGQNDKYPLLVRQEGHYLFSTVGPVKVADQVVGAVLVSSYSDDLVTALAQSTFADVTLYDLNGHLVSTTLHGSTADLQRLNISESEARSLLAVEGSSSLHQYLTLAGRDYNLLVGIFKAKGEPLGFYSVALEPTFITSYLETTRWQMTAIFAVTLFLVFGIGYTTANAITGRLQHLMENAMAVASGDFSRRTHISSSDEIGSLARSLDNMTDSLSTYTSALQHRIDELMALYESSTAVNVQSGLDLDQVVEAVTISVQRVIKGVDEVIVHLVDKSGRVLVPQGTPLTGYRLPNLAYDENSNLRHLLATNKPQPVWTGMIDSYSLNGLLNPNGAEEVFVVPLVAGQDVVGMLTIVPDIDYPPESWLGQDDELLLGTLANQAAIAIKNAQLFEVTQQAYEELRQLDDLKTQFINIAAHELRTPLGAMMGYASFVEKRVPPKLVGSVRFLVASTVRMRTMVDAMLTIQRLDAGTAFLRRTLIDVREVIKKSVADFLPMAELEGHTISVNLPEKLPQVQADAEKISLVLSNLLSNAIKFTPGKGCIEITAHDYLKGVLIAVRDTGVGIPLADQEQIFERFYQARAQHIAGHGGMGLGLTIVKQLVELHEGQVWLESEPGKGSTFSFTIPYDISSSDDQDPTTIETSADRQLQNNETLLELSRTTGVSIG